MTASPVWRAAVLAFAALLPLTAARAVRASEAAARTVVLANAAVPESLQLARYYLQVRGIPEENLCALDLPATEDISRGYYEERLRDPLLEFLRERKLIEQAPRDPKTVKRHESAWVTTRSSVQTIVSVYGVPLRIADTRPALFAAAANRLGRGNEKDTAAVDSELAMILFAYAPRGPQVNPVYGRVRLRESDADTVFVVVAGRLDGPDAGTVRRMIDQAVEEEYYGLHGRAYFDAQGLTNGSYYAGDYWIRSAYERFLREGYDCVIDEAGFAWGEAYPLEDAAVYFGWYTENIAGPFLRAGARFRPGAIAYHIHSSSAVSLREPGRYWTGPLLRAGAAFSMGAVSEPFLSLTPQVDLFADRVCAGLSCGEAAYLSLAGVSWQTTVVGDPLYTPFRYSLDEQIEHLQKAGRAEIEWAYVRKINRLVREGQFNRALEFCREKLAQADSLVLREKLGDLYARNSLFEDAVAQYEIAAKNAVTAETGVRVGARWILLLRLLGRTGPAQEAEASIRSRWKDSPLLNWLETAQP